MGKVKSVVLLTLISIVIAFLSAITLFPSFAIPFRVDGTYKKWNPVVLQFDLGSDLGGGYYTYYYPEGVIPASEFESNYKDIADATAQEEYKNSYVEYKGLYLEKAETSIFDNEDTASVETISQEFKDGFAKAKALVEARFEAKEYSSYRVAVVDDYALRVELPVSDTAAGTSFTMFANVGELTMTKGGAEIEELADKSVSDFIKGFELDTVNHEAVSVEIKLTKAGKDYIKSVKSQLTASTDTSSETQTTIDFAIGGEQLLAVYSDLITANNEIILYYNIDALETFKIYTVLLNSALNDGFADIAFKDITTDSVRVFEPVYGENALDLLYIALGVALVLCIALPIVFYRGYGVSSLYSTLSYLVVTILCFAFISGGVFEVTLGSVLVFLFGLVLVNVLNAKIYSAIKAEFKLGKTVESSVKTGYKKTMATVVDAFVIAVAAALFFLIVAAGLNTMAIQALICLITGAFCNLLWGRLINFLFLSASKNKYAYFNFVREEDDDDEDEEVVKEVVEEVVETKEAKCACCVFKKTLGKVNLLSIGLAVVLVAGIALGIVFGANLDTTVKDVNTLTVKVNQYVYDNELQKVEDICEDVFADKAVGYKYVVNGRMQGDESELVYVFADDVNLAEVKTALAAKFDTATATGGNLEGSVISASINSEKANELPASYTVRAIIASAVFAAFALLYVVVRHNFSAGLAMLAAVVAGEGLTAALMMICRVPVTTSYVYVLFFSALLSSVATTFTLNNASALSKTEKGKAMTVSELIASALATKEVLLLTAGLAVSLVLVGAIATVTVRWFAIFALISVVAGLFASLTYAPALYLPLKEAADRKAAQRARYDYKKGVKETKAN